MLKINIPIPIGRTMSTRLGTSPRTCNFRRTMTYLGKTGIGPHHYDLSENSIILVFQHLVVQQPCSKCLTYSTITITITISASRGATTLCRMFMGQKCFSPAPCTTPRMWSSFRFSGFQPNHPSNKSKGWNLTYQSIETFPNEIENPSSNIIVFLLQTKLGDTKTFLGARAET